MAVRVVTGQQRTCCTHYHRAVELIGKRWSGAILAVLRRAVPEISDRLLSERLKELEAEGLVERRVIDGSPVRTEYSLTRKGAALKPAVRTIQAWAVTYMR
jgi:DNA-binding HxlR family transcriptional regulator